MITIEKQLQGAIRRYWPCQRKTSTVALTVKEFNLKVERIMSMLTISGNDTRSVIVNRLRPQWIVLPPLDIEKDGYYRTYPKAPKIEPKKGVGAFDNFVNGSSRMVKHDGYQMFRKDESRALKWRQVR